MTEKKVKAKTKGQIKVTQTGSPIGRPDAQRRTLIGLGLNKLSRTLLPSVRWNAEIKLLWALKSPLTLESVAQSTRSPFNFDCFQR